jgi:hypothetical protein
MSFMDGLPRRWITVSLPGVGDGSRQKSTYESFAQVPSVSVDLTSFEWLQNAKTWVSSTLATPSEQAVVDLSLSTLAARIGIDAPLDLVEFATNPDLRTRIPSATDSYFDLGDEVLNVDGGRLLHLVSDSQWSMHWSLYIDDDGQTEILASDFPVGFQLGGDDTESWSRASPHYFRCAPSFGEFAWRWWMDNEIFFRTAVDKLPPTPAQETYLTGYGNPRSLD